MTNSTEVITQAITISSGFLTPAIAIATILIAFYQYRLKKTEIKLALYEKRIKVFEHTRKHLSIIMSKGHATFDQATEFYNDVFEHKFLFDKNIQKYTDEIYNLMLESAEKHEMLYPSDGSQGIEVGEERSRIVHAETAIKKELIGKIKILVSKYQPSLSLSNI